MSDTLFKNLDKNKKYFDDYFSLSADYFYKSIKVFNKKGAIVMCEAMIDRQRLWQIFLNPINNLKGEKTADEVIDYIINKTTIPANENTVDNFKDSLFFLTAGFSLLFIDGSDKAIVLPAQGVPLRSVSEPSSEGNLKGSKEGFTDSSRVNMALIRRRARGEKFAIEALQIGDKTKTEVCICYNENYADKKLVDDIKKKLNNINLPMIFDSGYLAPFIDDTKFSFFSASSQTERPDTFCAKLCEGKVGILVDGSPYALIYPYFFHENFAVNDDYTQRPYFTSFIRIIRYIAFLVAILLPGLYVSFTLYAPQVLPKELIFYIFSSKTSVLPVFLEAILIVIALEIIKEAGLRLPKPIGHSVSFVAALIIGDATVSAGFISSSVLIVCAVSVISSFVVPSFYEAVIILRILTLILSGIFGVIGFSFSLVFLMVNMINVNAAGYNYLLLLDNTKYLLQDGILKSSFRNKNKSFEIKKE